MYTLANQIHNDIECSHILTVKAINNTILYNRSGGRIPSPEYTVLQLLRLNKSAAVMLKLRGYTVYDNIRCALLRCGTDAENDYFNISVIRHFNNGC